MDQLVALMKAAWAAADEKAEARLWAKAKKLAQATGISIEDFDVLNNLALEELEAEITASN